MSTLLLFPPQWCPSQPYLSTPALTAYLCANGCETSQLDLNVEFYDWLLTEPVIKIFLNRVYSKFNDLENQKYLPPSKQSLYSRLAWIVCSHPQEVAERIENAKMTLRNEEHFFDLDKYRTAMQTINDAFNIVSGACFPTQLGFSSLRMRALAGDFSKILDATQDAVENPFLSFLEEKVRFLQAKKNPCLIGISIVGNSQLIPGLTLARLLRKAFVDTHINIGGSLFSRLSDVIPMHRELFTLVDSIVLYEGEGPLLALHNALADGRSLMDVPNLVHKTGSDICTNKIGSPEDINMLPTPSFDGLPLNKYFSPYPILPILSSRGCYWAKCTFCDHHYIYRRNYRRRDANRVADDMKQLSRKYNVIYFEVADEATAPNAIAEISDQILEERLNVRWYTSARLEKSFTLELLHNAKQAGCRLLLFGLESGCNRILELMSKGVTNETAQLVLNNSNQAGIWNHVFLIFGFPTETIKEAHETIEFVITNKNVINSLSFSPFEMSKFSFIAENPAAFNVTKIKSSNSDFTVWFHHKANKGMNSKDVWQTVEFLIDKLSEEHIYYPVYSSIHETGHIFLYACVKSAEGTTQLPISRYNKNKKDIIPISTDENWFSLKPKLADGFYCTTLKFDASKIKTRKALPNKETYIVLDVNSRLIFPNSAIGDSILRLCDGNISLKQVADHVSQRHLIPIAEAESECLSLIKIYYSMMGAITLRR